MSAPYRTGLVWFRRDLRAEDHAALHHALQQCQQVHCAFVFDRAILDPLPRRDRRVEFIRESLVELDSRLRTLARHPQAGLIVLHGQADSLIPNLALALGADAVFTHHDDEPAALARDARVRTQLALQRQALHTYQDHTVFERSELLTRTGSPYTVFTPYKKAWLARIDDARLAPWPVQPDAARLAPRPDAHCGPVPALQNLGFEPSDLDLRVLPAGSQGAQQLLQDFATRIDRYDQARDFPAIKGPSYLSTHLRFGTVSVRSLARMALERSRQGSAGAEVWLSELVWRDFYFQILHHHPHVVERSFKPGYDAIAWESGAQTQAHFAAWCEGRTGYPLVDAAMAQILRTGYMHNRLRMVVASFLTKDLGIDWRWGERFFALHLNDYDLAVNNGGWQWASSSGCDAQPYFRIFHPVTQSRRFDPQGRFIRRYLPALAALPDAALHAPWEASPLELQAAGVVLGRDYPLPIVDHAQARERTLQRYAVVKAAS